MSGDLSITRLYNDSDEILMIFMLIYGRLGHGNKYW